jgi:hypothetical protein
MRKTMFKLFATMTTLTSIIYAGGDIAPIGSSVEPAVTASSGDALSLSSMLVLIFLTTMIGLFFVKKESEVK